jgi:rhodanese-related sulfurtransferase
MDGEIDPDELAALLDDEEIETADADDTDLRIVDIRDRRAFDRGHIPDSECIPFPELTTRIAELEGAVRIVTVCPHGVASRQAAQLIGSYVGTEDARVESLRGGIEAWERDAAALVQTDINETANPTADADEGPDAPF